MKKHLKYLLVVITLAFTFSCDLPLQDTYDFKPEITIIDPYKDMTAWEFFNTPAALRTTTTGALSGDSYDYLVAAIKKAEFIDLYNQTDNPNRTYLMLNNTSFVGTGNVIQLVTGSSKVNTGETPDDVMARVDTPVKLEKLRNILKYHIVDAYVDQIPTLYQTFTQYIFQTLIPGEDGLIAFIRDDRYVVDINNKSNAPLPFPITATSEPERIRNYNYIFKNGIGHSINDPVRNKPY